MSFTHYEKNEGTSFPNVYNQRGNNIRKRVAYTALNFRRLI